MLILNYVDGLKCYNILLYWCEFRCCILVGEVLLSKFLILVKHNIGARSVFLLRHDQIITQNKLSR